MTLRKRSLRAVSGCLQPCLAAAVAVLLLLVTEEPGRALGGGDGLAAAGAAIIGEESDPAPAIASDIRPHSLILRAMARAPRGEGPRVPDGAPPQAPPLRPTAADVDPPAPGAMPVPSPAEDESFHLRLIGTARTPTGPPRPS